MPNSPLDFLLKQTLLSLASNVNEQYLTNAENLLAKFGKIAKSDIVLTEPYHNQMTWLDFFEPITYQNLLNLTKNLENQNDRNNFDKPKVTLDIDIVAFLPKDFNQNFSQILDEKNQTFIQLTQGWQGVARRLPLAEYDKLCFDNLCQNLQNATLPLPHL